MNEISDGNCKYWFDTGYCTNKVLQKRCRLTCGLCSTVSTTTATKASRLGVVSKCTLVTGSFQPTVTFANGARYCYQSQGKMTHTEAIAHCKKRNAKLPLPKNDDEVKFYLKHFQSALSVCIDLSDPCKSMNKGNWKDVEGNKPIYVQLRVTLI